MDVLRFFDALVPVAEQVIDVPKFFFSRTSRREPRFASRSWRNSWWKCQRSFTSSSRPLTGQGSTALLDALPEHFLGCFRTSPRSQKSAEVARQVSAGVVADSSSSTPAAHGRTTLAWTDLQEHVGGPSWSVLAALSSWRGVLVEPRHSPYPMASAVGTLRWLVCGVKNLASLAPSWVTLPTPGQVKDTSVVASHGSHCGAQCSPSQGHCVHCFLRISVGADFWWSPHGALCSAVFQLPAVH